MAERDLAPAGLNPLFGDFSDSIDVSDIFIGVKIWVAVADLPFESTTGAGATRDDSSVLDE
jgi:hypothetical protein